MTWKRQRFVFFFLSTTSAEEFSNNFYLPQQSSSTETKPFTVTSSPLVIYHHRAVCCDMCRYISTSLYLSGSSIETFSFSIRANGNIKEPHSHARDGNPSHPWHRRIVNLLRRNAKKTMAQRCMDHAACIVHATKWLLRHPDRQRDAHFKCADNAWCHPECRNKHLQ